MPSEHLSDDVIDIRDLDGDLVAELPPTVLGLAVQRARTEWTEPGGDRYVLWNRFAQ